MSQPKTLRVFISSPSDVRPERQIAERVVRRLDREFTYHFRVEPMLWEREPLVATHHFQDKITPPRETDIVVVILWSRLGFPLPADKFRGALTGETVTGTEWEFEDALASYRATNLPDLMLYRKRTPITGSLDDERAVEERLDQKRRVEAFMARWTRSADGASFTAASWEFTDATGFEEMLEAHLRELIRRRLGPAADGPAGIRWHGSPFRGLLSFDLDHAPIFFGRTRARNELRELLAAQDLKGKGFVLVMGASGSGKSSLVKAGLLSDLKLHGMIGRVALCRHAVFRPSDSGGDLLKALATALLAETALPELAAPPLNDTVLTLTGLLRDAPGQAARPIQQGLAVARQAAALTDLGEARLLIIIDQFEEIFTQDQIGPAERDAFVAALEALTKSGLVWVVATLRSDFFDRLETLPRLAALSADARYLLVPPEPAEIAQIIRQPAREAGLRFEIDSAKGITLDEVILQAASRDPGALPLLSFLLEQLWQNRDGGGVLSFAAYQALGALEGALGQQAEHVYLAQPPAAQQELAPMLRALVTVGSDGKATSRPAGLADFGADGPRRVLVQAFLTPTARLLVADGDAAGARIRVAHEALLTHWPRARDLVDTEKRDLEVRDRLEQGARRWLDADKRHRPSLLLPHGLPLTEALGLMARWGGELPEIVTKFIIQSRQAVRRQRQKRGLTLAGAMAALPILAGLIWLGMVWTGVRAVEKELAFVAIPPGCFTMGSPADEVGRFDHEKQHKVCVPGFELGKFAITQAQWRAVMVENPDPARFKAPNNPVEMVSWEDARAFAWRMRMFGHGQYRLPTEAEWEYAARGGTTTTWFWGDTLEDGCPYANLRDLTYKNKYFNVGEAIIDCEDGFVETAPVGSKKPNPFGLYDMIGNLFQWTEDCFGDYAKAPSDGSAAEAPDCPSRVVRGGSWTAKPRFTRSASRDTYAPVNRNDVVGFRLAK